MYTQNHSLEAKDSENTQLQEELYGAKIKLKSLEETISALTD